MKTPYRSGPQISFERFFAGQPERESLLQEARENARIARQVYDLRARAHLSQRALAKRVGTTASVICRLEDADYQGHSLRMLRRIARALGYGVDVAFISLAEGRRAVHRGTARSRPRRVQPEAPQHSRASERSHLPALQAKAAARTPGAS